MIDIDDEAAEIRKMLGKIHRLRPSQVAALPTLQQAHNVTYNLMGELLPYLFERLVPEAMQDMEMDASRRKNGNGGDAFRLLNRGPIKITYGEEEKQIWKVVTKLSHFTLTQITSDPFDKSTNQDEHAKRAAEKRRRALDAYQEFCVLLIEETNKPPEERTSYGNLLLTFFPIPSDAKGAPKLPRTPGSRRARRLPGPEAS